jgi:predicted RNase H-like HicB family nuclease
MLAKKTFSGFPVRINTEEDGTYWAEFITVPVFTQGATLAELETNMQEALLCYLESVLQESKKLPITVVNSSSAYA